MSAIAKPLKSMFGLEKDKGGESSQFTGKVASLSDSLAARVRGDSASLAEMQTTNALDSNLQNTISSIRSAPGISPALRARMISRAGERAGSDIARQGGEMRIAEQLGAERSLGQLLTGARQQDMSAFEDGQKRRGFLKEFAAGAGSAMASGSTG